MLRDGVCLCDGFVTQAYASLRKNSLSHNDVQCILLCAQGNEIPDHMKSSLNSKIDRLLQEYKKELSRNPLKQFTCLGGFHLNPKGIELALEVRSCYITT